MFGSRFHNLGTTFRSIKFCSGPLEWEISSFVNWWWWYSYLLGKLNFRRFKMRKKKDTKMHFWGTYKCYFTRHWWCFIWNTRLQKVKRAKKSCTETQEDELRNIWAKVRPAAAEITINISGTHLRWRLGKDS